MSGDPNERDDEKRAPAGGVNISGSVFQVHGDIVGGDKVGGNKITYRITQVDEIFRPLLEAVRTLPPERRTDAEQKVTELKQEVAKGKDANDSTVARLVEGVVEVAPYAVAVLLNVFGQPVLSSVLGPVTEYVLGKMHGK